MKRFLLVTLFLLALVVAATGFWGVARYDGVQGLLFRIRVAWAELQPASHPAGVPTPLPVSGPWAPPATKRPTLTVPAFLLATPAPARTSTPTAAPALTPAREAVQLSGLRHNWQTWNNCGPATLAMHLSYFGSNLTQETIRQALRPNSGDKNTGPEELAAFARTQGLRALVRINGNSGLLRQLLGNGLPVLVETWIEPKPDDGMGHYRVLSGYDDARQVWIAYDSFISKGVRADEPYQGIQIPYSDLTRAWFVFNNTYLVVFDESQSSQVRAILGDDWGQDAMWHRALADAMARTSASPDDAFAWFNLGTDLTALARYDEAAAAYDRARQLGLPWRMLWYQFGPFRAYFQVGRYQEVLALADATLSTTEDVEELHYWRARALLALGRREEALKSLERAVQLNPNYAAAGQLLKEMSGP